MADFDAHLSLVNDIYAAALDSSLWDGVTRKVADFCGCQAATFCVLDSSGEPSFPVFVNENFDPAMIEEYLDHVAILDPTVQQIVANPQQKIFHDSAFISEAEKRHHPYYAWHAKSSDTRSRLAGMARPSAHIQAGITIHRTARRGDFDTSSQRDFAMLFPHVERALEIGFHLGGIGSLNAVSLPMIDRNPMGVILFDENGACVLANRAANGMIEGRDGLTLVDGRFGLQRASDARRLGVLIASALKASADPKGNCGGVMTAPRPSGKRAYSISVSPLQMGASLLAHRRVAGCIVIADPEREYDISPEGLREIFDLTPAEGRLALGLAAGKDLRMIAVELNISYATARAQLTTVFRKTDTGRQAELVKVLLATLPLLEP